MDSKITITNWNLVLYQYIKTRKVTLREALAELRKNRFYHYLNECKNFPADEFLKRCPNMQEKYIYYPNKEGIDQKKIEKDFGKDWTFDMIGEQDDLDKYIIKDYDDDPTNFPFKDFA